jgi:hypothetical protein
MLDSIRRWLGQAPPDPLGWGDLAEWARSRSWTLRGTRESDGFVIEGRTGALPWRLEWGPSQRPYIVGHELRVRAELELPRELQVLVLNRELMESMEKSVFEQYVEGVQTRIDTSTPSEMRWLVMFPRLSGSELKGLRDRYGAVASYKPWLQQWLDGALTAALAAAPCSVTQPLVLMVARRRLSLRTALAVADADSLGPWLRLFDCALHEAQRVLIDESGAAGSPSTHPGLFSAPAGEGARP